MIADVLDSRHDYDQAEALADGERCRQLWAAVILQQVYDEAWDWFRTPSFGRVAMLAGIDAEAMVERLPYVIERARGRLSLAEKEQRQRTRARKHHAIPKLAAE